jgi:hypothetical protein
LPQKDVNTKQYKTMHLLSRISIFFAIFLQVEGFLTSSSICTTAKRYGLLAKSKPEEAALERTVSQLERLRLQAPRSGDGKDFDADVESLILEYLREAANTLKTELKARNLPTRGTKPSLARRLAESDMQQKTGRVPEDVITEWDPATTATTLGGGDDESSKPLTSFCGLHLSKAAGAALGKANFKTPSPIQQAAIPRQANGESIIIHAQTGSGKTLAYLLPLTEQLWKEYNSGMDEGYMMILTPTRELAAQVAGKFSDRLHSTMILPCIH